MPPQLRHRTDLRWRRFTEMACKNISMPTSEVSANAAAS
jgi:hypothetical protein